MAPPSSPVPGLPISAPIHFDDTLGALLVSCICIAVTFGIVNVQIYTYYKRCSKDSIWLKVTIAFLWALDTAHCVLISHAVYFYCVTNYVNPIVLLRPTWSLVVALIVADLTDAIVSFLYIQRLRALHAHPLVILALMFGVTVELGTATAIAAIGAGRPWTQFQSQFGWLWYVNWTGQAVIDLTITISLSVLLRMFKSAARRTRETLRRLMIYAVSTGALTASFSVVSFIVYAASPRNLIFIAISNLIPKSLIPELQVMVNSILALLNTRPSVQNQRNSVSEPLSIHLRTLPASRADVPGHETASSGPISTVEKPVYFSDAEHDVAQRQQSSLS